MRVRTIVVTRGKDRPNPVGTVIEHPDAWRFVELGVAEPIDDEAKSFLRERKRQSEERFRQRWDALDPEPAPASEVKQMDAETKAIILERRKAKRERLQAKAVAESPESAPPPPPAEETAEQTAVAADDPSPFEPMA